MSKLNQVIAVEKGVKSRAYAEITKLYKLAQRKDIFNGFVKSWKKIDDEGENRPSESKRVQFSVGDVLHGTRTALTELFDVTAQKDFANCHATADVVVDGYKVLKDVPVTYLLFLEKQLKDLKAMVEAVPTLSADEEWKQDEALGLYRTEAVSTQSTKKVQEPIVLYAATPEHPAQTQLISKDVIVGHWSTVKQSGAVLKSMKKQILARVDALTNAVKYARESANSVEAPKQDVGKSVFSYLFE